MKVDKPTIEKTTLARSAKGGLGETIRTLVYALLIALGVRTFFYEPFNIPSGSMIPTLLVGDYLFVSKMSYGYGRYSFPLGLLPFEGRVLADEPARGDVVVFRKPTDTSIDFIKRLVGMPGDRIQVKGGILHINDVPVIRSPLDDYAFLRNGQIDRTAKHYYETLPEGVTHRIVEAQGDRGWLDDTPEYQVPEGHYFMMGDNRDQSQDSRVLREVGFVPRENLIGRATVIFFSVDDRGSWWRFWQWPSAIRWGRIFSSIQ